MWITSIWDIWRALASIFFFEKGKFTHHRQVTAQLYHVRLPRPATLPQHLSLKYTLFTKKTSYFLWIFGYWHWLLSRYTWTVVSLTLDFIPMSHCDYDEEFFFFSYSFYFFLSWDHFFCKHHNLRWAFRCFGAMKTYLCKYESRLFSLQKKRTFILGYLENRDNQNDIKYAIKHEACTYICIVFLPFFPVKSIFPTHAILMEHKSTLHSPLPESVQRKLLNIHSLHCVQWLPITETAADVPGLEEPCSQRAPRPGQLGFPCYSYSFSYWNMGVHGATLPSVACMLPACCLLLKQCYSYLH